MGKVLVISPFNIFPPYWGAASRIYNLIKHLSNDYEITLLYVRSQQLSVDRMTDDPLILSGKVRFAGVTSFTKYSQIFNPLLILVGLILAIRHKYSLILAETGWSGLHAMLLSFVTRVPYIVDEHNVEWMTFKRMNRGGRAGIFLLRLYERIICKYSHKIVCVSENDRESLASMFNISKDKIIVVPNGVDTEKFHPDMNAKTKIRQMLGISEGTLLALFNGKLDYKPNYEAVEIIYREIMPRVLNKVHDVRFLIVGNNPPLEFSHSNLVFTNIVDRIEDYINASDVVICPLLSGGGTRLKVLEAIACGKQVISTTIGAEGLTGEETESHLKCVDDWDQFADEIVSAARSDLESTVSDNFSNKYAWPQVTQVLTSKVFDLLPKNQSR